MWLVDVRNDDALQKVNSKEACNLQGENAVADDVQNDRLGEDLALHWWLNFGLGSAGNIISCVSRRELW